MTRMLRQVTFSRLALLVLAALVPLGPDANAAEDWAKKMFEGTSHDFRTVGRGTTTEHHFRFTNLYQEDVRVASVRTSCGCTTPTVTKNLLKSRESAAIVAKFNTETHIGDKSAVLTVVFDKPFYSEVQLTVRGHIRTDVTFSPPEVNFGELMSGQIKRQEVVITHTGPSNWEIRDVRSMCSDLTVGLAPAERSPGLVRYRMTVETKGSLLEGEFRERLTLISNDQRFPTIDMAVVGRVRPSLEVSPASVGLGTVRFGESVEKRILVRADQEFGILDVTCADPRLTFEKPAGKKKLHFIKVNFQADDTAGNVSRTIEITTDLGTGKKAQCILSGTVAP